MKYLNFIKTVPLSKKREIQVWILLCTITSIVLIASITITSSVQWYVYSQLRQEKREILIDTARYTTFLREQQEKKEALQSLQKILEKIYRYKMYPKNPLEVLHTLRSVVRDAHIQKITIYPKHFEITFTSPNPLHAAGCVKNLNQSPALRNASLLTLHPQQNLVQVTIKGDVSSSKNKTI